MGVGRSTAAVGGGGGGAVPVRNPPGVGRRGRAVARGPWGARVGVPVRQALFVSRGLVVVVVEGRVSLQAVAGGRAAPARAVGRARRASVMGRGVAGGGPVVVRPLVVRRGVVARRGRAQMAGRRGAVARLPHGGGVGDVGAGHGRGLGQLAATSAGGAGPGGGGDGAPAHRTTALQQNAHKENQTAQHHSTSIGDKGKESQEKQTDRHRHKADKRE